jgi:hypothetical protein
VGSELRPALTNAALMDCASAAMVTSVLCASAACVDSVSCIAASAVCPACVHNHLPHPPYLPQPSARPRVEAVLYTFTCMQSSRTVMQHARCS